MEEKLMKKLLVALLALLMIVTLTACGEKDEAPVTGGDEPLLLLTGKNFNLRLFVSGEINCITRVEVAVMFKNCLLHCFVQAWVKISYCFRRKPLLCKLVVIKILQEL